MVSPQRHDQSPGLVFDYGSGTGYGSDSCYSCHLNSTTTGHILAVQPLRCSESTHHPTRYPPATVTTVTSSRLPYIPILMHVQEVSRLSAGWPLSKLSRLIASRHPC